jgi:hypothetical protein
MIKNKKIGLISFLIILLFSVGVSGYLGFQMAAKFFIEAKYAELGSGIIFDISALEAIRKNNDKDAIDILESRLDSNILTIGTDYSISSMRTERLSNVLDKVLEYRKKHNIKNSDPDVEKEINEIISLSRSN